MLVSKFINKAIPASEGEVLRIVGSVDAVLFTIENQDASNTLVYKFQESDDGTTWADIELPLTAGGTATQFSILASQVHTVRVSPTGPRVRLMASGDLSAAIGIQYFVDTPVDTTALSVFPTT